MSETFSVNSNISHYRILEKLGAGGMGEVYLAEDTRLERKVALKILLADVAQNAERMRRFEQEARAASSLNHPNIAHIYEIGESDGISFITMEYVEGVSLDEKIDGRQLPVSEIIQIGVQIADALDEAHSQGITHRDIKSQNVMMTKRGRVKVLDFGLAKISTKVEEAGSEADTRVKTQPGVVMGTVSYMSPEQALGRDTDARTDIWSLGVVLYEMATGRLPFVGESITETIDKIAHAQPEAIARLNYSIPPELEQIIKKALRKDRDERYQTAKDLLADLRNLKRELEFASQLEHSVSPDSRSGINATSGRASAVVPNSVSSTGDSDGAHSTGSTSEISQIHTTSSAEYIVGEIKRHKKGVGIALTAFLLATAGVGIWLYKYSTKESNPAPSSPPSSQVMKVTRLTSTGKVTRAAVSPDGKYAVHVVEDAGKQGLWIRQITTASNVNVLPPTEANYLGLTFSQDGNYVYFVRREKAGSKGIVYQMDTLGGSLKKITEGADGAITLSPDGKRFAFIRHEYSQGEGALVIANIDGSGERKLAVSKEPEGFEPEGLAWSPDGKVIACSYYSAGGDAAVGLAEVSVEDGAVKQILPQKWGSIRSIAWLGDGSGLLISGADKSSGYFYQIWHVSYPQGESRRITNDLNTYSDVSVPADSNTLLAVQGDWVSNLWIASNGDAGRAQRITSGKYDGGMGVAWTPDGRIVHASRDWDIWIMDADGSNQKLLTVDEHNNRWVSVTPDGRYILFESWRKSTTGSGIWRMDIDGGNPKPLTEKGWASVPRASPDGKWVVYESNASGKMTLWKMTIDGDEEKQLTNKITEDPAISPDGKLIACFYYPGQKIKIAVIPFEGGDPVYEFDVDQSIRDKMPGWTTDGRAITYILNRGGVSNIWSQPLDGGTPKQLTDFKTDRIFAFDWSRDDKQLLLARGNITNDVVLIRDFR